MRMWMIKPVSILCKNHLLGEHKEVHMLVGHLLRKRSISGYIKNNCLEPISIFRRHSALVKEMVSRGWNHKSPLDMKKVDLTYLPEVERWYIVDSEDSLEDLLGRCEKCRERYKSSFR